MKIKVIVRHDEECFENNVNCAVDELVKAGYGIVSRQYFVTQSHGSYGFTLTYTAIIEYN